MSERPLFEDNTYPHDRASQYLKLFAHSFDFSRFDLITLLLEWFLFSLWILFLFAKILLLMTWSWQYVFIPFFATLIFGLLRALLCGKRSRCALFVRVVALFFICIFVTFLLLKLENKATFSWHFVLAPLYLLFALSFITLCTGFFLSLFCLFDDGFLKLGLCIFWLNALSLAIFLPLIGFKMDNTSSLFQQMSWWSIFSPLWFLHTINLIGGILFFVIFPDERFINDNMTRTLVSRRRLVSIKPRYRTHFFYCLLSILNLPLFAFDFVLCLYLQKIVTVIWAPFAPLFILLIVCLLLIIKLIHAHDQRGTYCIRIDRGPGIPVEEIW